MSVKYSTIAADIKTKLEGISGTGIIHAYERQISDLAKFIALFKDSSGKICGWEITRRAVPEYYRGAILRHHQMVLHGYLGLQDATASSIVFQDLCDVTVCGTDSDTYKKIQRKQLNRRLEISQRSRNNKVNMTAEEIESESLDMLVACTKAWHTGERPELEMNPGEWLPCTPDNVRLVYDALPWLKEQIDQEMGDRSNFLQD